MTNATPEKTPDESSVVVKPINDDPSKGEFIAFFSFLTLGTGAFIALVRSSMKQEKKAEEERLARIAAKKKTREDFNNWITEQENDNKKVYKLADGRYLTVDYQANQEIHYKKEV